MNKETFKDKKGTFHYEPVVWGDWKVGDEIIFGGYNTVDEVATGGYEYTVGGTYLVGEDGVCDVGPIDNNGIWACPECFSSAFKFSRKVYDVVESVDELGNCSIDILTLDDAILHAEDKYKELKSKNQNQCADNHKMLTLWLSDYKTKLQEEKDHPKQEKSLDSLLKELHNLKQEEKELSAKIDNILKEINSVVGLYGLSILFTNEYDMLQEND